MNPIVFTVIRGDLMSSCPKCGEVLLGAFDADVEIVPMNCVGCSFKKDYEYKWPYDLPKFNLSEVCE